MTTQIGLRLSAVLFAPGHARARVGLGLGAAAALAVPSIGFAGWSALAVAALLLLGRRGV